MDPFFTFVVPCCNVEPYVEECINSVLNQSFQDWECIIGIETSKDRTEEVIRKLTSGDNRFRIFTGPCTGSCSVPRNIGIDMAKGKYIIFLDGDDAIADECLERLHKKLCEKPDADLYPCQIVNMLFSHRISDNYGQDAPAEMTGMEAIIYLDRYVCTKHVIYNPMLQMTVHRREFLIEHDLKCVPGLRCQDSEFSPRALFLAKRVVPLHDPFYLYRVRPNSIQTLEKDAGHFMKDWAIIIKSLLAFYEKVSHEDGFDAHVTPCWGRQWLSRLNAKFFSLDSLSQVPRETRVIWLKFIFENGFDSYLQMIKTVSFRNQMDAFFVLMFVRHPFLRWLSEFYFQSKNLASLFYRKLSWKKSKMNIRSVI